MDKPPGLRWPDLLCAVSVLLLLLSLRARDDALRRLEEARRSVNATGGGGGGGARLVRQDVLVFNRVPKVGSVTVMNLVGLLRERNGFDAFTSLDGMPVQEGQEDIWYPDFSMRRQAALSILRAADQRAPRPVAFLKHQNFFNYSEFKEDDGSPVRSPVYMNFVRHPVERLISWYYYVRAPWYQLEKKDALNRTLFTESVTVGEMKTSMEECYRARKPKCVVVPGMQITSGWAPDYVSQMSFFCGHGRECRRLESEEMYKIAKENVEKYYAVVGVLEDWFLSLEVLESFLPRFFSGARQALEEAEDSEAKHLNRNAFKPRTEEWLKRELAKNLTREIDFYHFCRQRLHRQHMLLRTEGEWEDFGVKSAISGLRSLVQGWS